MSWTKKVTNEKVLKRVGKGRTLMKKGIRKRHFEFLGHIMRKEKLENLTVTGIIEGKRSRGRERSTCTQQQHLCLYCSILLLCSFVVVARSTNIYKNV